MHRHFKANSWLFTLLFLALIFMSSQGTAQEKDSIPIEYYKLDNGLKVIFSIDKTAPLVTVAMYFHIGCRIEPRQRTGFAHLFEHMMFQGSKNLGKMEYIKLVETNGGILNGSTAYDYTNYFSVVPSNKLETVLWAEADRMAGLDVSQENLVNQQNVVKNEIRSNVLNQPYGGFPWIDMPQYANENWFNAHNTYGYFADLDSANLDDVNAFFKSYYSPGNAALVITGDFETLEAKQWIQKYFAPIPAVPVPEMPDVSEPVQTREKRFTKVDSLANRPAVAAGYKMPAKYSDEFFAMGLIHQLLAGGNDSRLHQKLVQEKGYTSKVNAVFHEGNMFDSEGPILYTIDLIHDSVVSADKILSQIDSVINEIVTAVNEDDLKLAAIKQRSTLYEMMGQDFGVGKANLLAVFALFDDDPYRINQLENSFSRVTLETLKNTARKYLRAENRTILIIDPKAKSL